MIALVLLLVAYNANGQFFGTGTLDFGDGWGGSILQQSPSAPVCPDAYAAIPDHTLCLTPDSRALVMFSAADKDMIVSEHNKYRAIAKAKHGTTTYIASDLAKLTWDEKLAKVAQSWANQCPKTNDNAIQRSIPEYGFDIGQSIHADTHYTTSWTRVLQAWIIEGEKYRYGQDVSTYLPPDETILHYTQMISNTTTRIGCGYSVCSNATWRNYYVCNYARGQDRYEYPFTDGTRCGACPGNCVGNLCANGCEGKICRNGGTLSFNDCTCKCIDMYAGPECETLKCPDNDNSMCTVYWNAGHCSQGEYFQHTCPYMCGVCKGNYGTFISGTTPSCKYVGVRQSPETCLKKGANGYDGVECASKGGQYNCSHCSYESILTKCPIMCGICEEPVPVYTSSKGCVYQGNRPSVEMCTKHGENGKDYSFCQYIGCNECSLDADVRFKFCPQLCGVCA